MNMVDAVKTCFSKYVTFSGRAKRSEYWWWVLFVTLVSVAGALVDGGSQLHLLSSVIGLILLLPGIAVSVRRLHDIGRSGWWLLLSLIPIVGALVLLYWAVQPSQPGANEFG